MQRPIKKPADRLLPGFSRIEEWKPLFAHGKKKYFVSNLGRVRRQQYLFRKKIIPATFIEPYISDDGLLCVTINSKEFSILSLMVKAFYPELEKEYDFELDNDRNPWNVHVWNLKKKRKRGMNEGKHD